MSQRLKELSFTFLYFNLGGEMMYVINQRLGAQNTPPEKSTRVIDDVLVTLFSCYDQHFARFVDSKFKLSLKSLKSTFESIISSSPIMRLSQASFNKLFDLIIGVLKFQVVTVPFPNSLLQVTQNHMNAMMSMAQECQSPTVTMAKRTQEHLLHHFQHLSTYQWSCMRDNLLSNFFIEPNVRVSILLRQGLQEMDSGSFIIPVNQNHIPQITHFDDEGDVLMETGQEVTPNFETDLGKDIYSEERPICPKCAQAEKEEKEDKAAEIKLLANLLGKKKLSSELDNFVTLDLLFEEEKEDKDGEIVSAAFHGRKESLESKVVQPQNFLPANENGDTNQECDLLSLMDS